MDPKRLLVSVQFTGVGWVEVDFEQFHLKEKPDGVISGQVPAK
jgi:hypothetical protein